MRTVNYSDVLRGSAALAGIQLADVLASSTDFALFRTAHDRRLQVAWEIHKWPDVCVYERRSFRAPWSSSTAYNAGDQVLDLPSLTYFQALQSSTNEPPTFGPYTNQTGTPVTVNSEFWAQSMLQYQADMYQSGAVYTVGSQVQNPTDGLFYQLFELTLLGAGAGADDGNGIFAFVGHISDMPCYSNGAHDLYWDGTSRWVIGDVAGPAHSWYQSAETTTTATPTPDLATGWAAVDQGVNPAPTITITAPAAPPGGPWGLLTPFIRNVDFNQAWAPEAVGEFLAAWDFDPRITTKTQELPFLLTADGATFTTLRHVPAYVWLQIRTQRPLLTGDAWNAAATYLVGQQVYFTGSDGITGNFYNCTANTAAGQSPGTTPASWAAVNLPYIFRQYLIEGGYADWLRGDGQTDKATAEETIAEQMLEFEADKLQRQQGQVSRFKWTG